MPLFRFALVTFALGVVAQDPFPAHKLNEWTWIDMPDTECIDGKATGVHIKYGSGSGIGIYLNGGGACFNEETCATCSKGSHPGTPGTGGIFDDSDVRNPFANYSWVNVPYCTGDVHLGLYTHKFDLGDRHFQGHKNLELITARAFATWPKPSNLVVTGESAGGFGSAASYGFVREHWKGVPGLKGLLLDDSGPVLDDTAIAVCLQEKWRKTWNLNASLPSGCPCIGDKGGIAGLWKYTKSVYPNDSLGLISSVKDTVISTFFSYGDLDCVNPIIPIGYTKLEAGLKRLAVDVPSYLIPGSVHTHTGDKSEFYTKTVNDVFLYKWVAQLLGPGPDPASVIPK